MDYQLIVIGAGPGGYVAALRAAKLGFKVAVVENLEAGGTCLNRGCVPTKTLLHTSRLYNDALNGENIGVDAGNININIEALFTQKRAVCEKLSAGIEAMFKSAKTDFLRGTGKIVAPGVVYVSSGEKECKYTCDNILVATGSVPAKPPIPGLNLPGVFTSDELLEGCERLPRSIVIIGGGVIGVEFANFYNDLGCNVTIIEGMDRLLPIMDRELCQNLSMIFKKRGIKTYVNSIVECVEQGAEGITVKFKSKDVSGEVSGETVLCAIGRKPYFEGLFAEGLSPETDGGRLKVDKNYMTSIPGVFAIGDVSSKIQLAHYASAQGTAFADMLCGRHNDIDMNVVPSCIYCRPEIASVGMTESQCKEANISSLFLGAIYL